MAYTLGYSSLPNMKLTYQIFAFCYAQNHSKSFWWWVVGGGGGGWFESEFSVYLWSKASAKVWTKLNFFSVDLLILLLM